MNVCGVVCGRLFFITLPRPRQAAINAPHYQGGRREGLVFFMVLNYCGFCTSEMTWGFHFGGKVTGEQIYTFFCNFINTFFY